MDSVSKVRKEVGVGVKVLVEVRSKGKRANQRGNTDVLLVLWFPFDRGRLGDLFKVPVNYIEAKLTLSVYSDVLSHHATQLLMKMVPVHFPLDLNNLEILCSM